MWWQFLEKFAFSYTRNSGSKFVLKPATIRPNPPHNPWLTTMTMIQLHHLFLLKPMGNCWTYTNSTTRPIGLCAEDRRTPSLFLTVWRTQTMRTNNAQSLRTVAEYCREQMSWSHIKMWTRNKCTYRQGRIRQTPADQDGILPAATHLL
jgi:hypothetical protein